VRTLAAVPPGPERERLATLFRAAADAIRALGELDLIGFEREEAGTADLSVWEALAPLVRDTFVAVQAFLEAVGPPDADASPAGEAAGDSAGPASPDRASAAAVIRNIAAALSRELTAFGEGLRRPAVAADRWNLLAHLGEFRGKFRLGIGEMVFLAARCHAPVRKAEVVPFYRQEIDDAVLLRRAFVLVGLSVHADHERTRAAAPVERIAAARRIVEQLEVFLGSKPWRLVRADDKRALLEARRALAALLAERAPDDRRLAATIEGLDKFLASLLVINHRETLIDHDREALSAAARRLERALDGRDASRARGELAVALSTAARLLGRDGGLDALLASLRRVDPAALDAPASRRLAVALAERIAAVPRP
jgi:hypothetical protein